MGKTEEFLKKIRLKFYVLRNINIKYDTITGIAIYLDIAILEHVCRVSWQLCDIWIFVSQSTQACLFIIQCIHYVDLRL